MLMNSYLMIAGPQATRDWEQSTNRAVRITPSARALPAVSPRTIATQWNADMHSSAVIPMIDAQGDTERP